MNRLCAASKAIISKPQAFSDSALAESVVQSHVARMSWSRREGSEVARYIVNNPRCQPDMSAMTLPTRRLLPFREFLRTSREKPYHLSKHANLTMVLAVISSHFNARSKPP